MADDGLIVEDLGSNHLSLCGRINTDTYMILEDAISSCSVLDAPLILDFADVTYVSSAGLRVLLKARKQRDSVSGVVLLNVSEDVREILDVTGFLELFDVR